jgi:hypothetical protein
MKRVVTGLAAPLGVTLTRRMYFPDQPKSNTSL